MPGVLPTPRRTCFGPPGGLCEVPVGASQPSSIAVAGLPLLVREFKILNLVIELPDVSAFKDMARVVAQTRVLRPQERGVARKDAHSIRLPCLYVSRMRSAVCCATGNPGEAGEARGIASGLCS